MALILARTCHWINFTSSLVSLQTSIYTPALLFYSKGIKLKNKVFSDHPVTDHIQWWCKSGDTTHNRYDWLKANIGSQLVRSGWIWLYVWLGTCNLTQKTVYIYVTKSHWQSAVDTCITNIQKIIHLIQEHSGCKITILEIPTYYISKYNKKQRHSSAKQFVSQDNN